MQHENFISMTFTYTQPPKKNASLRVMWLLVNATDYKPSYWISMYIDKCSVNIDKIGPTVCSEIWKMTLQLISKVD